MKIRMVVLSNSFSNWVRPSAQDVANEYEREYVNKPGAQSWTGKAWPTVKDFAAAVKAAQEVKLTEAMDRKVAYRSHTRSRKDLIGLLSTYRSWPQFRNESTTDALYDGFKTNKPMTMPMVMKRGDQMRVLGGNTRLDVAFQLGVTPTVLMIEVPVK